MKYILIAIVLLSISCSSVKQQTQIDRVNQSIKDGFGNNVYLIK
jgi:hypothetical protein